MLPPGTYREALPARELAPFVRRYWTTSGHAVGEATWRVLPDGPRATGKERAWLPPA